VSGQLHAPAALPQGNNPDTHWIGEWVPAWTRRIIIIVVVVVVVVVVVIIIIIVIIIIKQATWPSVLFQQLTVM
jgi:lipopolysaccharide/colanic/teichoic acid biosynthesis glycosyltransferase